MLNEDPHVITYRGEDIPFFEGETYGIGFDNNLDPYIGDPGRAHGDFVSYDDPPGHRSNYKYPGRIWIDEKVISFWRYPKRSKLFPLLKKLEDEFERRFPDRKPLNFKKGQWHVEVWEEDGRVSPGGNTIKLLPLEKYQKPDGNGSGRTHSSRLTERRLRSLVREVVRSIL